MQNQPKHSSSFALIEARIFFCIPFPQMILCTLSSGLGGLWTLYDPLLIKAAQPENLFSLEVFFLFLFFPLWLWFPSFKLITPPGSNSRSRPGWWDYLKQLLAGGEPGHRSWSHWGGSHNPGWAWVGRQVSSAAGSPKPRCLMSGSPTGLQVCSGSAQLAHRVLLKAEAAGSVIRNSQIKAVQGQECRWTSGWAPGELKSNLCSALFISLLRLLWQMTTSFVA